MNHPYYPLDAVIANYVPNSSPTLLIVTAFGAMAGLAVVAAYHLTSANARFIDRFAASWFALCAFSHVAFEGYYLYHRSEIAGMNTLFAQLWKEYTLSDSRYLTLDVFTVCVEAITVFAWGPLSLLTLLAIIRDDPARHPSQIVICTAHLYGVALYYLTNWAEGVSYSRPEFLYYWVYYAGMNAPWVIVPLCKPPTSLPLVQRYSGAYMGADRWCPNRAVA
ncbi:3-beta-hydroxysteroid-Delta(8),Delta(7)-isomerase-like protein [Hapsidospora chrysogenum ATCC 11550]|uniref:3-beta-hydroxysteroid-Delta(8), Delta(7)-isomerase-like protein n=1 Tax=Hapsidospora chrysogenum (strain ATCC 11550 / CBS 779.69 / DSM 880 / IAM 14645 / JCM 23072 / IMI 49137) TaxID=857340 RepID=A0A086T1J0_HAPC1|nr:3-beta-hydroxysteroid-Delta(8),Delta(7)-isomerase-like protein [Hapsidospora chrysogenum ATCC 11550]